jgi:hypothetical protein
MRGSGTQSRQDRARRMAQRPEALGRRRREPGVHARGPGRHRARRPLDRRAGGGRVIPLQLDQQHRLRASLTDQLEKGAVEQLDGGWLVLEQRGHGVAQDIERRKRDAESRPGGGQRIEPPLRRGDEAERPFGADHEIDQVARCEPGVQRVTRGVLAGAREPGAHDLRGGADGGRGFRLEPLEGERTGLGRTAAAELGNLAVGGDELHRLDPGTDTAVPHRARARRVGGEHAAERGPAAARGVGRQTQSRAIRGDVELRQGDTRAGPGAASRPVHLQPPGQGGEVDHDPVSHVAAAHRAAGAARHERHAVR